jgi:hypothetical protein
MYFVSNCSPKKVTPDQGVTRKKMRQKISFSDAMTATILKSGE